MRFLPLSVLGVLLSLFLVCPALAQTGFSAADLAGTWVVHALSFSASPTEPGVWLRGMVTFNASGGVTGWAVSDPDGQVGTFPGGTFTVDATGQIAGTLVAGAVHATVKATMVEDKATVFGVAASPANRFFFVFVKETPTSFAQADLAGSWRLFAVEAPEDVSKGGNWRLGSITIDTNGTPMGTLSKPSGETNVITGGSLALGPDGLITGAVFDGADPVTIHAVMVPGKDLVVGVSTTEPAGAPPGDRRFALFVALPVGGTFAQAELAGTWRLYDTGVDSVLGSAGDWARGSVTINGIGAVTSGSITDPKGNTRNLGGSITLSGDGTIIGDITAVAVVGGRRVEVPIGSVNGAMGLGKDTVAGVTALSGSGGTVTGTSFGLMALAKQPVSTVQFGAATYSVNENAGPAMITVVRTGTTGAVSVEFATAGGTATPGLDYTATSRTLTFAPGETMQTVPITIQDDDLPEGNETVQLVLRNPTGGAVLGPRATAVLTIVDNEQAVQFSQATYAVIEATANVTITVVRSGPPVGPVSVQYSTSPGPSTPAVPGTDYNDVGSTLTFANGQTSARFTVPILADRVVDGPKTVLLTLVNPQPSPTLQLGPRQTATLTITDKDQGGTIQFAAAGVSVVEGQTATLTVSRAGTNLAGGVTVEYFVADGGSAPGGDYTVLGSGTLAFGPGVTSQPIQVATTNNTVVDGPRTVVLGLRNPTGGAALGARTTTTLTITDNDRGGVLQFSAATYRVNEHQGPAVVRVTRTGTNLASDVSVRVRSTGGTATPDTDFAAVDSVLTFNAGESFVEFPIPIVDDTDPEGDETVLLSLGDPQGGASLGTIRAATLTIVDNEQAVQFSQANFTVTEANANATITVVRSGPPAGTVTVEFATSDGTATGGTDYRTAVGTLTFGPGVTSRSFTVPVLADAVDEPNETVNLFLRNPTGVLLGPQSTAVLTIVDSVFTSSFAGQLALAPASLPALAQVAYTTKGGEALVSDFAYPGYVELIVFPSTDSSTVAQAVGANHGTLVDSLPKMGLYVAKVAVGSEGTFLNALYPFPWLMDAAPLAPVTGATALIAIDSFSSKPGATDPCARDHGNHVANIMEQSGNSVKRVDWGGWATVGSIAYHKGSFYPRVARLLSQEIEGAYKKGEHAVINLSIQSLESGVQGSTDKTGCSTGLCREIRREQLLLFMSLLQTLESTTRDVADNTVVVIAAGNAGVDLDVPLQALHDQFPNGWKRVKIVGATDTSGAIETRFNSSDSNMVFARGIAVSALGDSCNGTSFAAPEVAGVLDEVWRRTGPGLTSEQLLQAFDQALAEEPIPAVPQDPTTGQATRAFVDKVITRARSLLPPPPPPPPAILVWSISGGVTVDGATTPLNRTVALPFGGGSASFALGPATITVRATASSFSVSGVGFGVNCAGSGGGWGPIVETADAFIAAGGIGGTVHCVYDDGSTENLPVTGSFAAAASK